MDGDEWPMIATDCEIEEAKVYGGTDSMVPSDGV